MRLSDLKPGEKAVIVKILGHGAFRKRVMEMGFVRGREVTMLLNAPLQDPVKYSLMDYEVSLRRTEAELIEVVPASQWEHHAAEPGHTAEHDVETEQHHVRQDKVINVAFVGNPNCGKTSLFNMVSGAHEHVGNYAGVTVGAKEGTLTHNGYRINIVDLPGTYSLSTYSPEEKYVIRYLRNEKPDVIVNVVVASNLERNLFLTTELIDMNRSMVIALNMYDELRKRKTRLDYEHLGRMLGVPIVPTVGSTGEGTDRLLDTIIQVYEMKNPDVRHIHVTLRPEVERGVQTLKDAIKEDHSLPQNFSPRYLAIKMLEHDPEIEHILSSYPSYPRWCEIRDREDARITRELKEDVNSVIASEKYGFIQGALAETMEGDEHRETKTTRIIDAFVTSRLFGFPIFLLVMWLMFWCTFQLGSYPMEWIEAGVAWLSERVGEYMAEGPLKDLLLDGIIGGVGGVIVFLPNILILYFFISFMEDSGYMARVAFIMDKLMHRLGLHGKSFIPLVMGFGCNVPAIMSTRIIESRSSRLITVLINPFMSCSARIPIYVLLVGCFFPRHGSLVFISLYLIGIVIAIITARLLRRFWLKTDETPFVMELPPYRIPTVRATVRNMNAKTKQYLKKMGGVILVASVIIWALSYFPKYDTADVMRAEAQAEQVEAVSAVGLPDAEQDLEARAVEYQQEHSYLGRIGKFMEPAVRPLGYDWKVCVSLLAGAAAKEVVVSTMGVLYTGYDDDSEMLAERLRTPQPGTGQPPFTPLTAYAFMVFVLVYFPCIASIVAIVKETGSWKYGAFSIVYNTALAWLLAFGIYRIGLLF